jgi:tetratricopeptide (TPR) repeat protein
LIPRRIQFLLLVVLSFAGTSRAQDGSDSRVQELYGQAKAAQSEGDVGGAIRKYEEILRIAPRLGPAYNNLGALYFRQRDYAKTAAILEQGLKVDPAMASASALLGISLFEMGQYKNARPRLEAALKANPQDANARIFLAKDLIKLNDYQDATVQLRQMTTEQPKNQEIWYLLARVYMKLSEQSLAKMNAIDPNSVLAHELSAEVMEAMNNYDGAVVELKKAVEMAPREPGTHYKLGDAYLTLAQLDSAAEQFQAELAVDPASCMAEWKMGNVILLKNGDADQALLALNKAFSLCPSLTDALPDRAKALMKLNRNQEAVADLQAAAKADPIEPSTHFLLSKALRALGRVAEAQAELQTFSKLEENARAANADRAQEVIKNKQAAH